MNPGGSTPSPSPAAPTQSAGTVPSADAWGLQFLTLPGGEGTILTGVNIDTAAKALKVNGLLSRLGTPVGGHTYIVYERSGETVPNGACVATGMAVHQLGRDGSTVLHAVIVVPGDVNGTGVISLSQVVSLSKALAGKKTLEGAYALAGDLDGNGKIGLTDIVQSAEMFKKVAR